MATSTAVDRITSSSPQFMQGDPIKKKAPAELAINLIKQFNLRQFFATFVSNKHYRIFSVDITLILSMSQIQAQLMITSHIT